MVKSFVDAHTLLEWMVDTSEEQPERSSAILAKPDYARMGFGDISQFEKVLEAAQRVKAINIEQGKRPEDGIQRVRLTNVDALRTHLGRSPARDEATRAVEPLYALTTGRPEYIRAIPNDLLTAWRQRKSAHQIEYCDTSTAQVFIKLLCSFDDGLHDGLDQRTFCTRSTGDSKAIERGGHASRLARVLGPVHGLSGTPRDILEALGICKFPTPISFRGQVSVEGIDFTQMRPYAAIAPDVATMADVIEAPSYVLSIENFASFNRYVRDIDDDSLVVFTAGYPSRSIIRFLQRIDAGAKKSIPFYHWGDIEEGGLQAFRIIETSLNRPLRPHLMNIETARRLGSPIDNKPRLKTLAESDSAIAHIAEWLHQGQQPRFLEQEVLDPEPPIPILSRSVTHD